MRRVIGMILKVLLVCIAIPVILVSVVAVLEMVGVLMQKPAQIVAPTRPPQNMGEVIPEPAPEIDQPPTAPTQEIVSKNGDKSVVIQELWVAEGSLYLMAENVGQEKIDGVWIRGTWLDENLVRQEQLTISMLDVYPGDKVEESRLLKGVYIRLDEMQYTLSGNQYEFDLHEQFGIISIADLALDNAPLGSEESRDMQGWDLLENTVDEENNKKRHTGASDPNYLVFELVEKQNSASVVSADRDYVALFSRTESNSIDAFYSAYTTAQELLNWKNAVCVGLENFVGSLHDGEKIAIANETWNFPNNERLGDACVLYGSFPTIIDGNAISFFIHYPAVYAEEYDKITESLLSIFL